MFHCYQQLKHCCEHLTSTTAAEGRNMSGLCYFPSQRYALVYFVFTKGERGLMAQNEDRGKDLFHN